MTEVSALVVKRELTNSGQSRYKITLSTSLTDFQYELQVREAARSREVSETEYMKECLIFGIEKGL